MTITAECSQCSNTLRVGDEHAGKKVRCPSCKNVVQLPGGAPAAPRRKSAAGSASSAAERSTATAEAKPKRRRQAEPRDEWDSLWSQNLTSYNSPETELPPDEAERRAKKRMGNRPGPGGPVGPGDRYYSDDRWSHTETETWALFLMICGGLFFIAGIGSVVCAFSPQIGQPLMWTGAFPLFIAGVIQHWRVLKNAWEEDILCGWMCRVVPFYYIYYVATRWQDNGKPFMKEMLASSAAGFCVGIGTFLAGINEAVQAGAGG